MNIVTLAEVKSFLGLTGTDQDDRIEDFIPVFEEIVLDYTKNPFTDPRVYLKSDQLDFVASERKIVSGDAGFLESGFSAAMTIKVEGSFFNDGFYLIDTVTEDEIVLASKETLISEAPSSGLLRTIVRADIPRPVKLAISRLISVSLSQKSGIAAEKIGSYSVNYKDLSKSSGLPDDVLGILNKYKKLY